MTPPTVDFDMYRGDSYNHKFQWREADGETPIDLTHMVITCHVRNAPHTNPPIVVLTEGHGISNGGETGDIDLAFRPDQTRIIPNGSHYDVRLEQPDVVHTLVQGKIRNPGDVTR